ncbi:MAG: hypothetical protein GWN99_06535 [Gemmatimonadetes bacterium]|uniref:Uncharacterized protein n=1 Tax=Candidatus Kutchimonas denitrificans TaxID=3056748 RepID=A0AAE4Z5E5_9BACT|nr:hypothetical protein [Gemmatimonadota bacterium]NIR73669.1 hypothetical protein [Candidatus Kutchimonas denitrificans]NIS00719.1 hypothetical protein [Gemmatimonadota bacterium]NIT66306.1 hypothetical protein [Gemmatimonadota bacterium]NIU51524.1 hypothetical protein [Gemmatimonadota bacterium]
MPKIILWIAAIAASLLALDRLLLWMESRGWLYYRCNKPRGGAATYHMMQIHSIYDPGIKEVIEIKYGDEQEEDESGEPPGPADAEEPNDGEG